MKRAPVTLLLLASGCAAMPASSSGSGWLVGTWLMMESPRDRDLVACASGLPIAYAADGTYSMWEESGTWRLAGDRLTETATEANTDIVGPEEVEIGRPYSSRIRRIGRDAFTKTYLDGATETFRRCPDR